MNSRKFAAIFLSIFVLGAFPLFLVQFYGAVSGDLSAGFTVSIENVPAVLLFTLCGLASVLCGSAAMLLLPLSAILLFVIGAGIELGVTQFDYLKLLMLVWFVLMAPAFYALNSRRFVMLTMVTGVLAFRLGYTYILHMPDTVNAMPYLVGGGISSLLFSGMGLCIGITLNDFMRAALARLKARPAMPAFISWLL